MEGPPFVNFEIPGGVGVAPVMGVSGVATTGQIWAELQKQHTGWGSIKQVQVHACEFKFTSCRGLCHLLAEHLPRRALV